ncbi:MAG: hypothetical protein U0572_11760 [Phycisphaerales bacterium]
MADAPSQPQPPVRKRRFRRIVLAVLVLIVAIAAYVVTRPSVLRWMLEPALAKAFGGEVELTDVRLDRLTWLRVGSMTLRAPGWSGDSAEVLRAESVAVRFSPGSLLTGTVRIEALDFGLLRLRAAERETEPGVFNLLALRPDASQGDEPLRVNEVDLRRIEVEMGTVGRDGTFRASGQRAFSGDLRPDKSRPGGTLFQFRLEDLDARGRLLSGTLDERTLAFTCDVGAIELDRASLGLAPLAVRQTAEAMNLNGRVRSAHASWSPESPLVAECDVEDTELTLNGFDLGDRWVRVENGRRVASHGLPTMRLKEGRIRYERDELRFEHLKGQVASSAGDLPPLPAEISLRVDLDPASIQAVDWRDASDRTRWLADFLASAPFELDLTIRGFESGSAAEKAVLEAPSAIAKMVELFGGTAWKFDVDARFSRGAPTRGADGSLRPAIVVARGQAFLNEGRGAYRPFPYPLEHVQAHLTFDQNDAGDDRVTVDYLKGSGSNGAAITVRGTVERPGSDAGVHLTLSGAKVPLDDALFRSFRGGTRAALESLFDAESLAALEAAELIPDDRDALAADLRRLETELRAATDESKRTELSSELAREGRMLEARSFRLGGEVNLDLSIARELGADHHTIVEGMIDIARADVLARAAPYPLHVTSGRMKLTAKGIEILDDGLRGVTYSGAALRAQGTIEFDQMLEHPPVRPDVAIVTAGDRITPLLLAAIPPPDAERAALKGWPGATLAPAAQLLRAARLQGDVDFRVHVTSEDDTFVARVDVQLTNGSVAADPADAALAGLPPSLALEDVSAVLRVNGDRVQIKSLKGRSADRTGTIDVSGELGPGQARSVELTLANMPIEPWMLELTRERGFATTRSHWDDLDPSGHVDASLRVRRAATGEGTADGSVTPLDVQCTVGDSVAKLVRRSGHIELHGAGDSVHVLAKDLSFAVGADGKEGVWSLDAEYHGGAARSLRGQLSARDGRWESPLIAGIMRLANAEGFAAATRSLRPEGLFDASASLSTKADGTLDWSAQIVPRTLACDFRGARPALTFDGAPLVTITPESVDFTGLRATTEGGVVGADAHLDLGATEHRAIGTLTIDADAWTPEITAFLPEPLGGAQRALGFVADDLEVTAARIAIAWDPNRGIAEPTHYEMRASATAHGGRFTIGLPFTGVAGSANVDFTYDQRGTSQPIMTLAANLASPSLRVFDRVIRNGTATIGLTDGGRSLDIQNFEGSVADGRVAGTASLDLRSNEYTADVRLTDAGLGPLLAPSDDTGRRKGVVEARLTVGGKADNASTRVGRGQITVRDATIASSLLTIRLVELSQLALPLSTAVRSADVSFFIDGQRAQFERFHLAAGGVDFDGRGFIDTRDFTIAAAFRTRGRVAIVRDIVGALTDVLWEIDLSGPLTDPVASLRPLPGLGASAADEPDGTR